MVEMETITYLLWEKETTSSMVGTDMIEFFQVEGETPSMEGMAMTN